VADRLRLRAIDPADAEFVRSLYAHELVTRALAHITGPISIEEARAYCEPPSGEHRFSAALQTDGSLVGVGTIREQADQPGVVAIGYSILPAFWNQGFGTELASLLIGYATAALNAQEIRATTREDNPASARVLEKLGFHIVEADAPEVDSRGIDQRVTRWCFTPHRP
jgi:[ribosomal protein S5]-alanine N-acetyltransferase